MWNDLSLVLRNWETIGLNLLEAQWDFQLLVGDNVIEHPFAYSFKNRGFLISFLSGYLVL